MQTRIDGQTVLRAPAAVVERTAGAAIAIDPAAPNWIATDDRGLRILRRLDGKTPFDEVVRGYAADANLDFARAWLHVETFARDALRQKFISTDGAVPLPYLGRAAHLRTDQLRELWLQVSDFCNLSCAHCLVSSGPQGGQGLPGDVLRGVIDQAVALGTERFFMTGGEPLARKDAVEIINHVVVAHQRELVILTNGTLFKNGGRLEALAALPAERLRIQISLDGASAPVNDPIRGAGSFDRICEGIRLAVAAGLRTTMTMVLLRHNLDDAETLVGLAADLGVSNMHLLWPHKRGRVLDGPFADLPAAADILAAVRRARAVARERGVTIDNVEELRLRFDGTSGIKNDLAGAGWTSLCLYTDGAIYPSASMAGVAELRCGSVLEGSLEDVWKNSPLLRELRATTVDQKTECRPCHLKFLCGGGDFEHGYWASGATGGAGFTGHDPYCSLYQGLAADTFTALVEEGRATVQPRSGFDRPVVLRGMGERTLHDEQAVVRTTHSACVLSEEVADRSRVEVREFYGHAAEEPQAALCCPVRPDAEDLAHIPPEVVERFYGCGSPVPASLPQPGETLVDLGSGAGIDCFVAARRVGPTGHVFGIDMTDQMLAVARECKPKVAGALGYDVVEFRQGILEQIPLDDGVADIVTSNCVINLSPDKPAVFREIWRILEDHGRMVIADIVANSDVPPAMRADGQLWGECISGALSEEAFLAAIERAGFYGVSILKKTFWREVDGTKFYSVTARGYKFEKKAGCRYIGQFATYLGPLKAALDEEGHLFPRGVPVEVCTDTAAKLSAAPYAGSFAVAAGEATSFEANPACCDEEGCC